MKVTDKQQHGKNHTYERRREGKVSGGYPSAPYGLMLLELPNLGHVLAERNPKPRLHFTFPDPEKVPATCLSLRGKKAQP